MGILREIEVRQDIGSVPINAVLAKLGYVFGWQAEGRLVFYRSPKPLGNPFNFPHFHLILDKKGLRVHYNRGEHRTGSWHRAWEERSRLKDELGKLDKKFNPRVIRFLQKEIIGAFLFQGPEARDRIIASRDGSRNKGVGRRRPLPRSSWKKEAEAIALDEENGNRDF